MSNESIMRCLGFNVQADLINEGKCPSCREEIDGSEFKDQKSRDEYNISGLCQKCQNIYFKEE